MKQPLTTFPSRLNHRFSNHAVNIGVITSRFNPQITGALRDGALEALQQAGIGRPAIVSIDVPGALEIPYAVDLMLRTHQLHGIVVLGAIIRGETTHHQHLADAVFPELVRLQTRYATPIGVGILTTETFEQCLARSGGARGNKGIEAACAMLDMLVIAGELRQNLGGPSEQPTTRA